MTGGPLIASRALSLIADRSFCEGDFCGRQMQIPMLSSFPPVSQKDENGMSDVLLVFAKVPRPGEVKTRLTPTLTPEEAAHLYEAFLYDALRQYDQLSSDVRLYVAPPLPNDGLDGLPDRVSIHMQEGEGLGARMRQAFEDAQSAGYDRAVVIGTDHPTLPTSFIRRAFAELDGSEAISIGPTTDGGFYLLGMSTVYPQLFEGMTYSHEDVFRETLKRAGRTGAEVTVLPTWYDVDTPAALEKLIADLSTTDDVVPRTRTVIDDMQLYDRPLTGSQ